MKVVKLSRLEIGSGLSFVAVAGNFNRGVSISRSPDGGQGFWRLDGSEVTASVGGIPSPATAHSQESLCHLVGSEIGIRDGARKTRIFLRLGILSGLVFLLLAMSSNSRFAIRNWGGKLLRQPLRAAIGPPSS